MTQRWEVLREKNLHREMKEVRYPDLKPEFMPGIGEKKKRQKGNRRDDLEPRDVSHLTTEKMWTTQFSFCLQ